MKTLIAAAAIAIIVTAATHQVRITERNGYRYIESNGIPDHEPGQFPNRGNPNAISEQRHSFRVPLNPKVADRVTQARGMLSGVGLNGIPFDPGTAEFWNNDRRSGWNYEAKSGKINLGLDGSNAHVQPDGTYHYHGMPLGLIHELGEGPRVVMVGYGPDGFPMYAKYGYTDPNDPKSKLKELKASYRVKEGRRSGGPGGNYDGTFVQDYEYVEGLGDLDECNGRFGVTPEYPDGTYYYVITEDYPFIPRSFRGTPDPSFSKGPPGGGRGGRGGMSGPPSRDGSGGSGRGDRPSGRRPPPRGGR